MIIFRFISVLMIFFFSTVSPSAEGFSLVDDSSHHISEDEQHSQMLQTTMAGVGVVTLWGVLAWGYFSQSPHSQSEGWFRSDTPEGGADKLGHMYSTYVFSHGLSAYYKHRGFTEENAALYGAVSSFAILGFMELGDSFSDYGFSYEDMLANGVGALLAYVLKRNPDLAAKIDYRWEYGLNPSQTDFATDYDNSKFLLALKLNGFESARDTPWRHVEFHLGYYARGYDDSQEDRERNIYLGIGLNLTDLLQRNNWKKTSIFLRYFQLPYTSINIEREIE